MKGGGGKGYQGMCWRCVKIGHKQDECQEALGELTEEVDEVVAVEEVQDEVWRIGQVRRARVHNVLAERRGIREVKKADAVEEGGWKQYIFRALTGRIR